jgi:hypothetical protein
VLNCSADPQPTGFDFVEWTITSVFLPEGQRLTAEQMRDLHERLNVPIAARSKVYVSDILGNAAWEGELTIKGLDAVGAEVILTYKRGSRAGAAVLNQRLILLSLPKDVALKNFKIIYEQPATAKKALRRK